MSFLGPIAGSDVCARYHVAYADFKTFDANEKALLRMAYACDVAHVREDGPPYNNHGAEVERVLAIAGAEPGDPWCASIWTAYLVDSGVPRQNLPELAASVHGWGEWAKEKGRVLNGPERGCAALIYHTATTGHLVAVASVSADGLSVDVIAGNTNDDGSREGYEVCRKTYPVSAFACFVDCTRLV